MPRKYEVTLDDGKKYEIDWDGVGDPTPDDLSSAFAPPTPAPDDTPTLFGRTLDTVQRVGNTLGRGGALVAGAAKEGVEAYQQNQDPSSFLSDLGTMAKDTLTPDTSKGMLDAVGKFKRTTDFNAVLAQGGMKEGYLRSGLGLVGDIVLDPLNVGIVNKGVGKIAKLPFTAVNKATDVIPGVKTLKSALSEAAVVPKLGEFVDTVEKSPTKGLGYGDMKRLGQSAQRSASEHAESLGETILKGVDDPAKLSKFIHAQDRGISTGDAALDAFKPQWQAKMDDLFDRQVKIDLLEPGMKRKNYVPYQTTTPNPRDMEAVVGANVSVATDASKKRDVYKTLQDAIVHGGAESDPRKILAAAEAEVGRAEAQHEFLTSTLKAFGKPEAREGFKKLNTGNLKIGKTLKDSIGNTYVPEKIANDLERAVVLWEKPSEMDGLWKTGMKVWKSMATSVNPGHHITNHMGNISNMFIGGMDAKDIATNWTQGFKIARAKSPTEAIARFPKIGDYSPEELYKAASKWEILGTSSMLGDLAEKGTKEWIANNPVFKLTRRTGTRFVEEPARLGMFLHEIKKGKTPAEAAIRVKDVLFDYSELTSAEKKLRDNFVPFYTWIRKNIPLQMQAVYKNPDKVEKMKDIQNMFWNANETSANDTVIPEKGQKAGYVPTGKNPDGFLSMNKLNLPINDLNRLTDPSMLGDALGPIPKLGIEFATGNKFYGGPIEKPSGLTSPAPAASLLGAGLNYLLPKSAEGFVTPTLANDGRNLQNDYMSWLMNALIPTGVYGSTAKLSQGEDPKNPSNTLLKEILQRSFGLTPDVISPTDQQFEFLDRKKDWSRDMKRKVLLEK